uniref:CW-type domain-containing protein n=1 Tax=Anolis carolinensis TaxID=28377 RepID=G1KML7_ANOCA|nr:PREDICTED: MORC family CW-type zinc finger protein 3 isoform X1 [Anolis carolinensis]|eukprot:XP_003219065.1 PREDICTED: MORC family CW-type zinc finger protein 3 isoform X1 [Anolis carolinensis]
MAASSSSVQAQSGILLSALCPKFLHTNSTSHTWPFSAVAELIDNAYDPDVNAKQMWIDQTVINGNVCLIFMDNGNGMNADKLHKMLSFGFSDKVTLNGRVPVGLYGNGFKSGSMRLGKDAIVFTKNGEIMSVGMLSQTFLEVTKAEHVIVPIISFNKKRQVMNLEESAASLRAILEHSLFPSEEELLAELDAIIGKKGTRIIIWNLRREKNQQTEFDFGTDKYDIRIPADLDEATGKRGYKKQERQDQITPESDYSLRAYCSILYLKPRMQIIIRGQKVQTQLVSKSLAYIERDVYRPKFLAPRTVRITFGFNCRNKDHYGMMMYHRNRLIKAYERVGYQLKANNMGVGVVGIIECSFLKPTHNKQDFDYTNEYRLTIHALGEKLNDYWNEMQAKKKDYPLEVLAEDTQKRPDQTWVQCDSCLKWRKLPDGIHRLPEKWYCSYNPDPQFRNCNVPEEPEDDDLIPYEKTHKKKDREKLKKRLEFSQQIYNELYLPTSSALPNTSPAVNERLHTDASNTPISRSLNPSDNAPVSSPHSDHENRFKRKLSNPETPLPFKITGVTSQAFENRKKNQVDDDDVIILEENSTPKPADIAECDIKIVKVEGGTDINYEIETESAPNKDACSEAKCSKGTVATQTEREQSEVKKEDVKDNADNNLPISKPEVTFVEPVHVLDPAFVDSDKRPNELSIKLQSTTREKENYQKQCDTLLKELNELKQKLVEMNDKYMKKEMCHQSTETDSILPDDELRQIKERSPEEVLILYEQALNEVKQLKVQCNTLKNLKNECNKCRDNENKSEVDDMAVQIDDLFRQLDECSVEKDQYKNEIELLEMEKNQLRLQCEELKEEVTQLKASVPQVVSHSNGPVAGSLEDPVNFSDGESLKLRSLRVNVGMLLASIMPDLDLQQMNYDVDVVDEILGQVVEHMNDEISSA